MCWILFSVWMSIKDIEKTVRNWGSIAFWQQSGGDLKASMGVHMSRASEKTHGAGQMRLSVYVYQCPSKDTTAGWG